MKAKLPTFKTPYFPVKGKPDTLSAEPIQELIQLKYEKSEVQFEHPASGMNDCDECIHYDPSAFGGSCYLVKGQIGPEDWCNKFRKNPNAPSEHEEKE